MTYIQMMVISTLAVVWMRWLVFSETEIAAATTATAAIATRYDTTNQDHSLQ